jgi:nicotinate phosphoribosyltransferase
MHATDETAITDITDVYFKRTREVVKRYGSACVTYAIFMRPPVVNATQPARDWLQQVAANRGTALDIDMLHEEGAFVGAGDPIMYITGDMAELCDLETLFLQKTGVCCVTAYNTYNMCAELPNIGFLAFGARHCAGAEMQELSEYAVSVGSKAAQRELGAKGFVGNAVDATAHYFGNDKGMGTMPHALIGYAGSTVRAAEMFHETYPDVPLSVLVDYYGQEITDSLSVCRAFPDKAANGELAVRLDTGGSRHIEGLDQPQSYDVLERNAPHAIRGYRTEKELKHLVGPGVSAAAIWLLREKLDNAGFDQVKIIASSGFGPQKCRVIGDAEAPVDLVGTGSYLPENWPETYATADIVMYDDQPRAKVGREYLQPNPGYQSRRSHQAPSP